MLLRLMVHEVGTTKLMKNFKSIYLNSNIKTQIEYDT